MKIHQEDAAQFCQMVQDINDKLEQKIKAKEDYREILEEFNYIEEECQRRTILFETLVLHFNCYRAEPKHKEIRESAEFATLYQDLLDGVIDKDCFESRAVALEKQQRYRQLEELFNDYYNQLSFYSQHLSPEYAQLLVQMSDSAKSHLQTLSQIPSGQSWSETLMSIRLAIRPLEGMIDRMEDINEFFVDSVRIFELNQIETIILSRLKNEMTAKEFDNAAQNAIVLAKQAT